MTTNIEYLLALPSFLIHTCYQIRFAYPSSLFVLRFFAPELSLFCNLLILLFNSPIDEVVMPPPDVVCADEFEADVVDPEDWPLDTGAAYC